MRKGRSSDLPYFGGAAQPLSAAVRVPAFNGQKWARLAACRAGDGGDLHGGLSSFSGDIFRPAADSGRAGPSKTAAYKKSPAKMTGPFLYRSDRNETEEAAAAKKGEL